MITARQYGEWWAKYEIGDLLAGQTPPPELVATAQGASAIYLHPPARPGNRRRRRRWARGHGRRHVHRGAPAAAADPGMDQAVAQMVGRGVALLVARLRSPRRQETRAQAEARADPGGAKLIARAESGQGVLVFAHGYFNHMWLGAR